MSTIKVGKKWENKGAEGTHGTFATKSGADSQREAMFSNGYKAPGYSDGGEVHMKDHIKKILEECLDKEINGGDSDLMEHVLGKHEENTPGGNALDKEEKDHTVDNTADHDPRDIKVFDDEDEYSDMDDVPDEDGDDEADKIAKMFMRIKPKK